MTTTQDRPDGLVGFALTVGRNEGIWSVTRLPDPLIDDLDGLLEVLADRNPAVSPFVLVDVDDEFFAILRPGPGPEPRVLLSDVTAAADYDIAAELLDLLGEQLPEDLSEVWPAGDLGILADYGLAEMELGAILADMDLYADDMVSAIAHRLGFAAEYSSAVDLGPVP
ncbi:tRNA adenosine deaminase-associated protein [Fodinicola feengrottensis]|uniref:tRNA adenosine deaminase-associated protein n=1 Tax=Fodinicola feengrottensis TaxID=435914 RepID=A0ABN2H176_9ACTN|nr:tRNA adenosine deaminase-associated protein [Fodinicola feengrottensis]